MADPYASVADNYDLMIDWPARIARERPFFETLFRERGIRSVLDIGCGTGHHARMFADLGAEVVGLDPSAPMLARARALTPGGNPSFTAGGFEDVPMLETRFDFIAVIGNTLAHVETADGLARALSALRGALSPDGALCIQLINYDSLQIEGSRWLPLIHRQAGDREFLFLREHRVLDDRAEFTIITLIKDNAWQRQVERDTHLPLTGALLQRALHDAGFAHVTLYGSYQREPFMPDTSPSLVVLATL